MNTTEHVLRVGLQHFLQIGLGDEKRSQNTRLPWQRIIYQQDYRAGFLVLNIPFEEIDTGKLEDLRIVAVSRDEVPGTAPPFESWEFYKLLGPVEMYLNLGCDEEWIPEKLYKTVQWPDETVAPDISPKTENGNAFWDDLRYNDAIYSLYNVLLLRKQEDAWERIRVGKMYYHAFHLAMPNRKTFVEIRGAWRFLAKLQRYGWALAYFEYTDSNPETA